MSATSPVSPSVRAQRASASQRSAAGHGATTATGAAARTPRGHAAAAAHAADTASGDSSAGSGGATAGYDHLPLAFEPNMGQADTAVSYLAHGPGYSLFLTGGGAVLALHNNPPPCGPRQAFGAQKGLDALGGPCIPDDQLASGTAPLTPDTVLRLALVNPRAQAPVAASDALSGTVNYLTGNDPSAWHTNIPTYGTVAYQGVYPGVDWVYHGDAGQLEYDFVVQPGADPSAIALTLTSDPDGGPADAQHGTPPAAAAPSLDAQGDLTLQTAHGTVVQRPPLAYQTVGGARQPVQAGYRLLPDGSGGQRITFSLGSYDRSRPLVIDPVLSYSTYLGGNDYENNMTGALDSSGDVFVGGTTQSSNYPTTSGSYQAGNPGGGYNAFVAKLNPTGTGLIYSTYIGGSNWDLGYGLAINASGNAYLTGWTQSTNFPTLNAYQASNAGGNQDAFVTELNMPATGWSTAPTWAAPAAGKGAPSPSTARATPTSRGAPVPPAFPR